MLTKSASIPTANILPIRYTTSARNAFRLILSELTFSENKKLLLPAYIGITDREGSGVFDPVLETATPYEFYSVDRQLSANKEDLYGKIKSGEFRALLVIHYFGFCQNDMAEILELCRKYDVLVIEDCAHSLLSSVDQGELGHLGDFGFYSLHKIFATQDGGLLRVNNQAFSSLTTQEHHDQPAAETLETVARADLQAIRTIRRNNYLQLLNLTESIPSVEALYPNLGPKIVPHNFPILIADGRREEIYFDLIERGVPAIALYYRMIDPINDGGFTIALEVSQNILNLPVHQDVTSKDVEFISDALIAALDSK